MNSMLFLVFRDCPSCKSDSFQQKFQNFKDGRKVRKKCQVKDVPIVGNSVVQSPNLSDNSPLETPVFTPHSSLTPRSSLTPQSTKRKYSPSEVAANAATVYESANKSFKAQFDDMELSDALIKVKLCVAIV